MYDGANISSVSSERKLSLLHQEHGSALKKSERNSRNIRKVFSILSSHFLYQQIELSDYPSK